MIGYIWVKLLTKLQGAGIRDSVISPKAKVGSGSIAIHSNMGKYSYCGRHCLLSNVEIGNFCSIGDRVVIGGEHIPCTGFLPLRHSTKGGIVFPKGLQHCIMTIET